MLPLLIINNRLALERLLIPLHFTCHLISIIFTDNPGKRLQSCRTPEAGKALSCYPLVGHLGSDSLKKKKNNSSGTCLEDFQILPFLQIYSDCGGDECLYGSKSPADKSYWLSVDPDGHFSQPRMTDIEDIKNHIGRCHVCLGQRFTLTRHSFKDTAPDCPKHFSALWTGYSHLMVSFNYFSHVVLVQYNSHLNFALILKYTDYISVYYNTTNL